MSDFLEVYVQDYSKQPTLFGGSAGYEGGEWRAKAFANYIMKYILEFTLSRDEWDDVNTLTAYEHLGVAARTIYQTAKYGKRGEFGELLLHTLLREFYGTDPLISKLYFKDTANDTVKGFDSVHLVIDENAPQLWLGEAKFYTDIGAAIRDAATSLLTHFQTDYLKNEFTWIRRKLPHNNQPEKHETIASILKSKKSLDHIFPYINVPVVLTYNSPTLAAHTSTTEQFKKDIATEINKNYSYFLAQNLPQKVAIHVLLIPLHKKKDLQDNLHAKLTALQALADE